MRKAARGDPQTDKDALTLKRYILLVEMNVGYEAYNNMSKKEIDRLTRLHEYIENYKEELREREQRKEERQSS